jgi:cytochrome P450
MTIWHPVDNPYSDLTSHDTFSSGVPYNTFERLRADDPVHWTNYKGGKGFWSITRHKDISSMIGNTKVFTSAQGIRMEDQSYEEYMARRTFQEVDGFEHRNSRMKVAKAFSGPVIIKFEESIRSLCSDILDVTLPMGSFDATKQIARELPMRMLGRILGIPEEDLPWLVEKGDALIANTDPDFTDHVLDKLDTNEFRMMPHNSPAGAELYEYAKTLMEKKSKAGETDGILHMILQPSEDGSRISEIEFKNFFCQLVAAGNDTTRYSIAAGIHALCHQPELLNQMKNDPLVWETAPDEIIRWASPVNYFRRTATEDFEIHNKFIKEGDKVLYWFASANRDPNTFENPFEVDLYRKPNKHQSFGQGGPHICLGIWLARLEVRCLFQELSKRIKSIQQVAPHKYLRSNFVNGIKELPININLN